MDSKRKNTAQEPLGVYEISIETCGIQEERHPLLIKVLEKSIQHAREGKGISHEEMQRRIKEKFPFLK